MKTPRLIILFLSCCSFFLSTAQDLEPKDTLQLNLLSTSGSSEILNTAVDFIPPSPEAGSLFRASTPRVNEATGSPQIAIGLGPELWRSDLPDSFG